MKEIFGIKEFVDSIIDNYNNITVYDMCSYIHIDYKNCNINTDILLSKLNSIKNEYNILNFVIKDGYMYLYFDTRTRIDMDNKLIIVYKYNLQKESRLFYDKEQNKWSTIFNNNMEDNYGY